MTDTAKVPDVCGDCEYVGHTSGDSETCEHPAFSAEWTTRFVDQYMLPPEWCPLRREGER